jgi:type I restriction enzyme S subunit
VSVCTVPLGKIIRPAPVRRAGEGEYPLLSMTMRDGLVEQKNRFKKRIASRETKDYRVVKRGELVVGFPIDEAVLAIQRVADEGIVSPAYAIWNVDTTLADDVYLERFLRSEESISYYKAHLRGTTARRRTLPPDKFRDMPVPLPPLEQQRRLGAVLDKADAIRRKRAQTLALADDLLKSAFLDLFGDPITNSKGLPVAPIKELGKVITGNTPPRADSANYGDAIEWIKSDNINTPDHFLTPAVEYLSETGKASSRTVPALSTLVTCIAGSPNVIGNASLADREVAFNQQINAVVPNRYTDPYFLYCQFLVGKKLIQASSTNSMKGMVSKGKFQEIKFLRPSYESQRHFGRIFEFVMRSRDRIKSDLLSSEQLFGSLTTRAFRGEL